MLIWKKKKCYMEKGGALLDIFIQSHEETVFFFMFIVIFQTFLVKVLFKTAFQKTRKKMALALDSIRGQTNCSYYCEFIF